jgi:trehalose utilization protein
MPGRGLRVAVWDEHVHEHKNPLVAELYPDGIHGALAAAPAMAEAAIAAPRSGGWVEVERP